MSKEICNFMSIISSLCNQLLKKCVKYLHIHVLGNDMTHIREVLLDEKENLPKQELICLKSSDIVNVKEAII